jgi:hypothetical protein
VTSQPIIGAPKGPRLSDRPHVIDGTSHFVSREPVIASVAERICHRFANGALERSLSIEFGTRREFIEALIRRDYRRLREENLRLLRRAA